MHTPRRAGGIRRLHLLTALLAVLVFAGACGGSSSGSGADAQAAAEVPAAGIVATAGGGEFDLAELDDGPAIVWFWAPW